MHLRWTEAAATDLERIADYLFSHAPDRAPRLIRSIYEAPETLLSFPYRGRPGMKAGTRELVLSPLPWIVVYTVETTSSTSFASSTERNDGPDEWHATWKWRSSRTGGNRLPQQEWLPTGHPVLQAESLHPVQLPVARPCWKAPASGPCALGD